MLKCPKTQIRWKRFQYFTHNFWTIWSTPKTERKIVSASMQVFWKTTFLVNFAKNMKAFLNRSKSTPGGSKTKSTLLAAMKKKYSMTGIEVGYIWKMIRLVNIIISNIWKAIWSWRSKTSQRKMSWPEKSKLKIWNLPMVLQNHYCITLKMDKYCKMAINTNKPNSYITALCNFTMSLAQNWRILSMT